jgi:hypothetical protein
VGVDLPDSGAYIGAGNGETPLPTASNGPCPLSAKASTTAAAPARAVPIIAARIGFISQEITKTCRDCRDP